MTRPIPISAAAAIAKKYDYDQVIVYARKVGEDGIEHVTTYGIDRAHCDAAAKIGNHLKYKVFGWTEEVRHVGDSTSKRGIEEG